MDALFANDRLLDPVAGDADMGVLRAGGIRYMNSGHSKIYAMTLASFPIYDSRVALEGTGGPGRSGRTLVRRPDGVGVAVGAFPALFMVGYQKFGLAALGLWRPTADRRCDGIAFRGPPHDGPLGCYRGYSQDRA